MEESEMQEMKCGKHFMEYEFYCMNCMELICKKCITDHSKENHVCCFLEDYGRQYLVSSFDEVVEEIQKNKEELDTSPVQSKEAAGELVDSLKELKKELDDSAAAVGREIEVLDRLKSSSFLLPNIDELLRIIAQCKKSLEEEVKRSSGVAKAIEIVQSAKNLMVTLTSNTAKIRRAKEMALKVKGELQIAEVIKGIKELSLDLKMLSSNKLMSYSARVGIPLQTFNIYGVKEQTNVLVSYNVDTKALKKVEVPIEVPAEPTLTQIDDRLYITGGGNYLSSNIEYIEGTDQATLKASMSLGKKWHSTVVLNAYQFLVIGGYSNTLKHLNAVERYTTDKDMWEDMPRLNEAKQSVAACLFERKEVYVFGGYSGIRHKTVEYLRVSPMGKQWLVISVEDPASFPMFSCGAAAQISLSEILILRGNSTSESFVYNINDKTIRTSLPTKRRDSFLLQTLYPVRNRLCAIGYYGEAHLFDYQSHSWEDVEYMLA